MLAKKILQVTGSGKNSTSCLYSETTKTKFFMKQILSKMQK